jgi:glycosyltransferase involved in cell wall biosynthesis
MKLSIIIPFFNVEEYISQCLDSVYSQDISESDFEVICINDNSTDGSKNIVLKYQKKHTNLILVEHETNKKQGAARNTGLKIAKGRYVWFIDSDDFIKSNVFKNLLTIIETNNLEILHFNTQNYDQYGKLSNCTNFEYNVNIMTGIDYCRNYLSKNWILITCTKMYSKEFLFSHGLFFQEGVYFEDMVHSLKAIILCKKFLYIKDKVYYYRHNSSSTSNSGIYSGIKLSNRVKYNIDSIEIIETLISGNDKILKEKLINGYIWALKKYLKIILLMPNKERHKFYEENKNLNIGSLYHRLNFLERIFYFKPHLIQIFVFPVSPILRGLKAAKSVLYKLKHAKKNL